MMVGGASGETPAVDRCKTPLAPFHRNMPASLRASVPGQRVRESRRSRGRAQAGLTTRDGWRTRPRLLVEVLAGAGIASESRSGREAGLRTRGRGTVATRARWPVTLGAVPGVVPVLASDTSATPDALLASAPLRASRVGGAGAC